MGCWNCLHHLMAAAAVAVLLGLVLPLPTGVGSASTGHDYRDALAKSILFFEGQRSGKLPAEQRVKWRGDSALKDGQQIGVDLVGGYYDAGDNIKFGFPMAYTTTLLSWSVVEFGQNMGSELNHAMEAIRWATDYLLKATNQPNTVHVQVADPYADHNCWERPEDMDTDRSVYTVDASKPGSEVAGETAAALAAASMAFRASDPNYASWLLNRSMAVFDFADRHRGSYSASLGKWVCPFYCDFNGYQDELVWASGWIYKASNNGYYLNYFKNNVQNLVADGDVGEFGWDNKHAGIYVLLYKMLEGSPQDPLLKKADQFACTVLPESPTRAVDYSPGGLLYKPGGGNFQHSTAISLLLLVYAGYLTPSSRSVTCGQVTVPFTRLVEVAKRQADYILGSNPLGLSYMVGYSNYYPQRIHHRGSSLPSIAQHPSPIRCKDGTPYFLTNNSNPNVHVGAIVGGPNNNSDAYHDSRPMSVESEPMTYVNAAMVGILAYLTAHG